MEEVVSSEEAVVPKVEEELSKIDGVLGWVLILQDGQKLTHQISESENRDAKDLVQRIKDLSFFLSSVTRLGNFVGGILSSSGGSLLLLPLQTHFLAVKLDQKVDFKNLVKRIKSVI